MKLYDLELSGNCYKIRLFCALNNIQIDIAPVDYLANEHKSAAFLNLNPLGQIPVLDDEGVLIRDSHAILIYLAQTFRLNHWLPHSALTQARIMEWLSFSANDIARGPNDARLHDLFGLPLDIDTARNNAKKCLDIMDAHLATHTWLAHKSATIADIACFPYVALVQEGGVSLQGYDNIHRWIRDIKALDGFIPMPGLA
ncbi:glutathione S-transferase family protein [Enterovibrio norvegicus]|uniref:glutathione S-transferase family protein n=1 Tax=Enterovibrio norvegicus TaxID=188144 RepID=UPI00352C18A2